MLQSRPPIVVILGHVDHGKTTLLDSIRKSSIAAKEAGGITQHIRSFQHEFEIKNLKFEITFVDTPGHSAFSAMRSRGTKIADIALLVIAADDGVMPQTKESLGFIRLLSLPFVVVISKSDLPHANPQRVKSQLAELGVLVEGFGGQVPTVVLSAKTGTGVDDLLEVISLLAQLHPPQADPQAPLEAIVLESRLDPRKGPLTTVIVKNGTLQAGSQLPLGKVRALIGPAGQPLTQALPSQPVEILGLSSLPEVGSIISSQPPSPSPPSPKTSQPSNLPAIINIVLRADVTGSLEAILNSLPISVQVLLSATGNVTENDVLLAKTAPAVIFAFNVKVPASVAKLAQVEKVCIFSHAVIYELLDQVDQLSTPPPPETVTGQAQILAQFKVGSDQIAGCRCTQGSISKSDRLKILRRDQVIATVKIKSLRQGKNEIQSVSAGTEFGAIFSPLVDFQIGDSIMGAHGSA